MRLAGATLAVSALAALATVGVTAGPPSATAAEESALDIGPPTRWQAWVGRVVAPVVARRAPRSSARAITRLRPRAPFAGGGTTLLITRTSRVKGRRWAEVLLPIRPNGRRGWVPLDVLRARPEFSRLIVDVGARRLILLRGGRRVLSAAVAVGKPSTPTPVGRHFAVAEEIRTGSPGAFLGPVVFALTGYSEALNSFDGGNGRVAIHGTSLPGLLGSRVSHGCVRVSNPHILRIARAVGPGTPVEIRV